MPFPSLVGIISSPRMTPRQKWKGGETPHIHTHDTHAIDRSNTPPQQRGKRGKRERTAYTFPVLALIREPLENRPTSSTESPISMSLRTDSFFSGLHRRIYLIIPYAAALHLSNPKRADISTFPTPRPPHSLTHSLTLPPSSQLHTQLLHAACSTA